MENNCIILSNYKKIKKLDIIFLFIYLVDNFIVCFIEPHLIISLNIYLLFSFLIYRIIFKNYSVKIFEIYSCYALFAILLYLLQYYVSGTGGFADIPGGGVADDKYYYFQSIDIYLTNAKNVHPFVLFLKTQKNIFLFWLKNPHLLDMIFFNLLGIVFIPQSVYEISILLFKDKEIAKKAYVLTFLCPYLVSNGIILMRDVWVAELLSLFIFSILQNKYSNAVVYAALMGFLRLGSLLLFTPIMLIFAIYDTKYLEKYKFTKIIKFLFSFIIIFIFFYFFKEKILEYANLKSFDIYSLTRTMTKIGYGLLYKIYEMPIGIKSILITLYFFIQPLAPGIPCKYGYFVPLYIFLNIYSILFLYYLRYFIYAVIASFKEKNNNYKLIFFCFFIGLFFIANFSIQIRHKLALMPLFYLIVAVGFKEKGKLSRTYDFVYALLFVILFIPQFFNLFGYF
jgi:hypothetical protein